VEGAFLLSVYHYVTGPKTASHALRPFQFLLGPRGPSQQGIKPGTELLLERRGKPNHKLPLHLLAACLLLG
jgi:hypothetical protein